MSQALPSTRLSTIADRKDVLDELNGLCQRQEGWVQGSGYLENVELRVAGEGADPRRLLPGRWMLTLLQGPMGGPYSIILTRASRSGVEIWAGELLGARSLGVRLLIVPTAPLDRAASAARKPAPETDPGENKPETEPSSWVALAQAAEAAEAEARDIASEEDGYPERGDLVHHFVFGLCEVLVVNGSRLTLRDLKGPGRIREIVTDMLVISHPEERDGKRVFKLTRKN